MNPLSANPDTSALPESLRVLSLVWSLNFVLERTSSEMEATHGVSGPQRFLLRFVGLEPGITKERLGEIVMRDAAEMQSDLDHLVAKNLLTAPADASGYHLTGLGAGINSVMKGTVEEAVSKALEDGLPYERTSFRRMLERVLRELDSPR
jgi:hypothetical protein